MAKKFPIVFMFIFLISFFLIHRAFAVDCSISATIVTDSDKSYCQQQLNDLLKQESDLEAQWAIQNKQTGTLNGDITVLTTQINALKTKIKARSNIIAQLANSIEQKVSKIETLSEKIDSEHESLAQLLRNTNEFDNGNIMDLILSDQDISDFYSDLESYASIKQAVKTSVEEITGVKVETETQKKDLETQQNAETDAKVQLESAQNNVAQSEAQKKQLLAISKDKAVSYQKLAAEKKAKADQIRSALFRLAGISQKIEFGIALQYANEAKQKTGIDPAFLLAILTQESNLGANVGSCYVTDIVTGNGKGANTGSPQYRVMHPTRDIPIFMDIVSKLGLNYSTTRVSCWQPAYTKSGNPSGWGGAMGPAQFIPSTWILFESRLKDMLGYEANPWSPRDAFMASAIYLTDMGAIGDSASAQNRAACSYYGSGGSSCSYSRSVAKLEANIQNNINLLSN